MELNDLIVLKTASNPCYPKVVSIDEIEGIEVDIKKQTWSNERYENVPISKPVHSSYCRKYSSGQIREGIIAVYDRTNTKHLNSMVHQWQEFRREPAYYPYGDD